MTRRINTILWIGLLGTLILGSSFADSVYQAYWGNQHIWWTPPTMRLSVAESKDSFELYIGGVSLQNRLSSGTLLAVDNSGESFPVVAGDISIRLNNWEQTRASFLTSALASGVGLGASITLLLVGLFQVIVQKRKQVS